MLLDGALPRADVVCACCQFRATRHQFRDEAVALLQTLGVRSVAS
jgi:hypothetical protein